MLLKTQLGEREVSFDTTNGIELTLPVKEGPETVNAYYIPDALIVPFAAGGFIGSKAQGGSCNCETITFNAHGNGTHTECVGHISTEHIALHQCLKEFLFLGELISIQPAEAANGDFIITHTHFEALVKYHHPALLVRTLPNDDTKKQSRYAGTNPTYLTAEAALWLRERGVEHLLIDTPSVDREEDGGELAAHHAFWNYPANPRMHCTITEMIYAAPHIPDGEYIVTIAAGAFDSDASPSRVVLHPLL